MDDLIRRQDAINTALEFFVEFLGGAFHEDDQKILMKRMNELPSTQSDQKWTPVTDGLPKAGVRYQVTFESGEVGYADFRNKIVLWDGSFEENVWEIERYYEEDGKVIAWMPLPEPWKGEEDATD